MQQLSKKLGLLVVFTMTTTFTGFQEKAIAQLIPDHTLNGGNSVVTSIDTSTYQITGGMNTGINLFHSFEKFNIDVNKTVLFVHIPGVENILTRVTGNSISNILGTLKVESPANFYLINPNGIFFGDGAKLNIQGSFIATTADEIKLGNRGLFSAKIPENSHLLNIQPSALFVNALNNQLAKIENQGNLEVGKNLTLFSSNINNQGTLTAVNGTMQLTGAESLINRGNITANTLFLDTKDLVIGTSNNATIYESTLEGLSGNTNLILQASNNITIENLINNSLIFKTGGGNIQFIAQGNLMMNTNNTLETRGRNISISGDNLTLGNINTSAIDSGNSGNILFTANRNITTKELNTGSIIPESNAGNITINAGGNINTTYLNSYTYSEDSAVGNGGNINLKSAGNIFTDNIYSFTISYGGDVGNAGNVNLKSAGNIFTRSISSYTFSYLGDAGNGGNIALNSNGYISTRNIDTGAYSRLGNSGNGGNIDLDAKNYISTSSIYSYSFADVNTENGGNIHIHSGGDISVMRIDSSTESQSGNAGIGGKIYVQSGGKITIQDIYSYSQSYSMNAENGGNIYLGSEGNITINNINSEASATIGNVGNGGNVHLSSNSGILDIKSIDTSSYSSLQNSGNGGEVTLTAAGNINIEKLQTDSYSNAKTAGNGGNVSIKSQNNISTLNIESYSKSDEGNSGKGGDIFLDAGGNIETKNLLSHSLSGEKLLPLRTANAGNAGDIAIKAKGNITTENIFADSYTYAGNSANGGNINVDTQGNITSQSWKSSSFSNNGSAGNGGNINLTITDGMVNIPYLEAGVYGNENSGSAGKIILSGDLLKLNNIVIRSDSQTNAGEIKLAAELIELNNTDISSTNLGNGTPGEIYLQSSGEILLNNSRLFTALEPGSSGNGGNIKVDSNSLKMINFSLIDTGTYSKGNAGDVQINAANIFMDNDSNIRSLTTSFGNAGNINLNINQSILLQNGSSISTAATSQSSGNSGNIIINSNNLTLTTGSQLQALTSGTGKAGDIFLNSRENININGFLTGVFTSSEGLNSGEGGQINVYTKNLILTNGGLFNAQTFSKSEGGSMTINADNITLNNGGQLLTNTFGLGKAGEIKINANHSINIAGINSYSNLSGNQLFQQNMIVSDSIKIDKIEPNNQINNAQKIANNQFTINQPYNKNKDVEFAARVPFVSIQASGNNTVDIYSFDVNAGTRGVFDIDKTGVNYQTIDGQETTFPAIDTKLTLLDSQGNILATNDNNSHALGAGGSLVSLTKQLDPYLRYTFTSTGTYYIQVSNFDDGGVPSSYQFLGKNRPTSYNLQMSLESPPIQASVANSASVSGIFANTESGGKAGNITLNTPQLNIDNNGEVSAKTTGSGTGGNININANILKVSNGGQLLTNTTSTAQAGNMNIQVRDNITLDGAKTGLFANTEIGSSGNGGSINIDPEIFIIRNGAGIGVNSQGSGKGGNISLQAGTLILDNHSFINAETTSNQGGEIDLQIGNLLLLRNNSKITATAGTNGAGGNGGNININSPLIVGFTKENSDITANAFAGKGGNINITTKGIFGLKYLPNLTPESDITASSKFGIAGNVDINTPDVNPASGLIELPTNLVDVESLAGNSICDYNKFTDNTFVITGKGGLPANSNDLITNSPSIVEWANRNQELKNTSVVISRQPMVSKNRVIAQAQGLIISDNGKIFLTAESPQVMMQNAGLQSSGCK